MKFKKIFDKINPKFRMRDGAGKKLIQDLLDPFNEADKVGKTFLSLNGVGVKPNYKYYRDLKKGKMKTSRLF